MGAKEKKQVLIKLIKRLLEKPIMPLYVIIQNEQTRIKTFLHAVEVSHYFHSNKPKKSKMISNNIEQLLKAALSFLRNNEIDRNITVRLHVGEINEIKESINFLNDEFTNIQIA